MVDRVCPGSTSTTTATTAVAFTTTTSPDARIAMPDVVGKSLQSAQNISQAAGLRHLKTRDTTGQNRQRLWDRNWVVTQQTPVGGTMVDDDHMIDLGAEKYTD